MENIVEKIQKYTDYCLNCKVKPCQKGCPLANAIPDFIQKVKNGDLEGAYQELISTTFIGSLCGRVCPHERQCQGNCVRGIKGKPVSIGEIEAFIFDQAFTNKWYQRIEKEEVVKGKKVAIIGSGPAGLMCSAVLAKKGAKVDLYEKHEKLGGILRYGIPDFRLPKEILDHTIEMILSLGIDVHLNQQLGEDFTLSNLEEKYDAVFLGIGANVSSKMQIDGEALHGVYGGNELLEYGNHPNYKGKRVAVIGGGNVAMDTARTIQHLGAEKIYVIYRRAEEQMPAEKKEIENAKKEGVEFLFQNNIVQIIGNQINNVKKIECIKTELIQKEGESRKVPVNIEGSNYRLDIDYVVMAVGSQTEKKVIKKIGLKTTNYGYIEVNENYQTSQEKVFAAGDLIGTKSTVAWAARSGREAANAIVEFLKNG